MVKRRSPKYYTYNRKWNTYQIKKRKGNEWVYDALNNIDDTYIILNLKRIADALEESNILKEREIKVLESIDKTLIEEIDNLDNGFDEYQNKVQETIHWALEHSTENPSNQLMLKTIAKMLGVELE